MTAASFAEKKCSSGCMWNNSCVEYFQFTVSSAICRFFFENTVNFIVMGHLHRFGDSGYLWHFSTEIAEIWCPGTSSEDDWTCKFSALYLLYFQSYETFSWGKSGAKLWQELKELKFFTNKWRNLSVSEPSSVYALSVLNYGLWH